MPVLVETDGDKQLVLCEARAILDHLEETVPEPALLGRDPAERAEARRLLAWFDRKFEHEAGGYILHEKMEKRLLGMGAPRPSTTCARAAMAFQDPHVLRRQAAAGAASGWQRDGGPSLADFAAAAAPAR